MSMNLNMSNSTIFNPCLNKYYLSDNIDILIDQIKNMLNKRIKIFYDINSISTLGVYSVKIPKSNFYYADNALFYIFYFKFHNENDIIRKYKIRVITDNDSKKFWHGYVYDAYIVKNDNWMDDLSKRYIKLY